MEVTSSLIELFTFFFTHREKTYVQYNELRTELFTNLQKALIKHSLQSKRITICVDSLRYIITENVESTSLTECYNLATRKKYLLEFSCNTSGICTCISRYI